ncbi:MAG: VOC family protein [Rhodospirillaceae bacterium]|nr:VOC family protein [Rhodospirillaceae bacterium]
MTRIAILLAFAIGLTAPSAAAEPAAGVATLQRAAIMVKNRPATVKFYREVLGYTEEPTSTDIRLPTDHPLGMPPDAVLSMTYMKSLDGAFVAVMGVDSKEMGTVTRPTGNANAYNDVMLVHVVTGIEAIHARAVAGGYTVLSPPILSRSGRAKQMFLRDPNGIKIELNEMIEPKK